MTLAFYKVNNSQGYERSTFYNIYDNPQEIKNMLCKLSDDELCIYNMNNKYDVDDFEEDYNNEVLDGGWWCIAIND